MANRFSNFRNFRQIYLNFIRRCQSYSQSSYFQPSRAYLPVAVAVGVGVSGVSVGFCRQKRDKISIPRRLQRFSNFASVEYNGVAYMTPQDLLDSLVLDAPRERVFRNVLEQRDVEKMLRQTPGLRKGDKNMFRMLGHNGIISYAEYLFLLTLLTKSNSSFKLAFTIFDDDGNELIDKEEFLKLRSMVVGRSRVEMDLLDNEEQFESLMTSKARHIPAEHSLRVDRSSEDETDCKRQDTTILMHLFGPSGRNTISFQQFQLFYNNLQRELIEIEFFEFARGKQEIAAVDFAKLVLRYSLVTNKNYEEHLKRVASRVSIRERGITLDQFEQFSRFLNNLEDFARAVRLYSTAELPVSPKEFIRAVKCSTGLQLDDHLVDVIFKIFDVNNDGNLSYNEFIEIMNDRLHRGFKNRIRGETFSGFQLFKNCVVHEMLAK